MTSLPKSAWSARRQAHIARVTPWITPRLERKSLGQKHPVDDFLFEYYSYRPGQLLRWHPGADTFLEGASPEYDGEKFYRHTANGLGVPLEDFPAERLTFVRWLRTLLANVQERPALFGCWGLHEWAMVYHAEIVRHPAWPLRLTSTEIASTVDSLGLRCTHYDAFRFFTAEAAPLNKLSLTRPDAPAHEQRGCLHANMDLYKWAYKLAPFSSSELVADAFELARDIRCVDMQASPYDLRAAGCEPIPIEREQGRAMYEKAQRDFSLRADPIRSHLIALCDSLLAAQTAPA